MIGELLIIAASLCWALGANLYRGGLMRINPTILNLVRSGAAALLLLAVNIALGRIGYFTILDGVSAAYLVGGALAGWAIGDTLYFLGLRHIGVSRTVSLTYAYPLFMMPLSLFLLNERLTASILAGTFSILSAIWLISGSGGYDHGIDPHRIKAGVSASILAALCWAIGTAILKKMMERFDPVFIAFFKLLVILPFLAGYISLSPNGLSQMRSLDRRGVLWAVIGGLIAVGFGDMIYLVGLSLTQANIAASLGASTPIFASIIAAIFLRERIGWRVITGVALVAIGSTLLTLG